MTELIPQRRVLFKKLIVTRWSRNYQSFMEHEGSILTLHIIRSQLNQTQILTPYLFNTIRNRHFSRKCHIILKQTYGH
jgi:hypothetical protein